jgi:hypothetical protein
MKQLQDESLVAVKAGFADNVFSVEEVLQIFMLHFINKSQTLKKYKFHVSMAEKMYIHIQRFNLMIDTKDNKIDKIKFFLQQKKKQKDLKKAANQISSNCGP